MRTIAITLLSLVSLFAGCAPMATQQLGFSGGYQGRHGGISIGGSGSTAVRTSTAVVQSMPIAVLSGGNGYIVNDLSPNACPGTYKFNGNGWTCPGGQVQMGQYVLRQNQYLLVPQNTSSSIYIPGSCQVGGKDFGDVSEDTCLKIRDAYTRVSRAPSQRTFDGPPKSVNGHTCSVVNDSGKVLADFLDSNRNPKGIVVASGTECTRESNSFRQSLK